MGTISIVDQVVSPQQSDLNYDLEKQKKQIDGQSNQGLHNEWVIKFNLNSHKTIKERLEQIEHYAQTHGITSEELLFGNMIINEIKIQNKIELLLHLLSEDIVKRKINIDQIGQILLNEIVQIQQEFTIFDIFNRIPQEIMNKALVKLKQADIRISQSELSKNAKLIKKIYQKFQNDLESLKTIYQEYKLGQCFDDLKFKKKNGQLKQNIIFTNIGWNIFHEIAQQQKWDLFSAQCNELYFTPNNNHITPYHIFLAKAPIQYIIQFTRKYEQQIDWNKSFKLKNYIHSLCENKNLENQNISELVKQLQNNQQFQLLHTPYQDMIPLVYYLSQCKTINQEFVQFLSQGLKTEFNHQKLTFLGRKFTQSQMERKKILTRSQNYLKKTSPDQISEELTSEVVKEFQEFYLFNVQLAKVLIKRKFDVDFDWIVWFTYSNYVPYEAPGTYLTDLLANDGYFDKINSILKNQVNLAINKQEPIKKNREHIAIQVYKLLDLYNEQTKECLINLLVKISKDIPINNYLDVKIPNTRNLKQKMTFDTIYNKIYRLKLQDDLKFMLASPQRSRYFDQSAFMNIIKNCYYDNDDTSSHQSPYFKKQSKQWKFYLYQHESRVYTIDLIWIQEEAHKYRDYLRPNIPQTIQLLKNIKLFEDIFTKTKEELKTYHQIEKKQRNIFNFYKKICENSQSYQWIFDKIKNQAAARPVMSITILQVLIQYEIPNSVELLEKIKKSIYYDIEIKVYNQKQFDRLLALTSQTTTLIDRVKKFYVKTKKKSFRFKYISMYNKGMEKFFDNKTTNFYDHYGITLNHIAKAVIRGGRDNLENLLRVSREKEDSSFFKINALLQNFTRQMIKFTDEVNPDKQSKSIFRTKYFLILTQQQEDNINENFQYLWKIFHKHGKFENIYKYCEENDSDKLKEVAESIWDDYKYLVPLYRFLNQDSLELIGENLVQIVKQQFKYFHLIYQSCLHQFQKDKLIEIYFKLFEKSYPKFLDRLDRIVSTDKQAAKKIFLGLYNYADQKQSIRVYSQKILFRFLQTEEEWFEYVEKVGLTTRQISRLFQIYYVGGKINSMYKLLYYSNKLNIDFNPKSIGRFIRNQLIHGNLFKAMNHHYCLVLNSTELTAMRELIKFDQTQIDQCAILTVSNGLIDNFKVFMDNKLNSYQQIYAILRNIQKCGIIKKYVKFENHFMKIHQEQIKIEELQEEKLKQEKKEEEERKLKQLKEEEEEKLKQEKGLEKQEDFQENAQNEKQIQQETQKETQQDTQQKTQQEIQQENQQEQQQEKEEIQQETNPQQENQELENTEQQENEQQVLQDQEDQVSQPSGAQEGEQQQAIEQKKDVDDQDLYKPQTFEKGFLYYQKFKSISYFSNSNPKRKYFLLSDIHFFNNDGLLQEFIQTIQLFVDQIDTTKDEYTYLDNLYWLKFIVKYQRSIKSYQFVEKGGEFLRDRHLGLDKDFIIQTLIDAYKNNYEDDDVYVMLQAMSREPERILKLLLTIKNPNDDSDNYKKYLPQQIISKKLTTPDALNYLNCQLDTTEGGRYTRNVIFLGQNGIKPLADGTYYIASQSRYIQQRINQILVYTYHPDIKLINFRQLCALLRYEEVLSNEENSLKLALSSYNINLVIQAVVQFKLQIKKLKKEGQNGSQEYKQQKEVVIQVFYYLAFNFTQDSINKYFDRFIGKKSYQQWLQLKDYNLLHNLIYKNAQLVIQHIFRCHLQSKYGQQQQFNIINEELSKDNNKQLLLQQGHYYLLDFFTPTYEELLVSLKVPKFINLQQNFHLYQGEKSAKCLELYEIITSYLDLQSHDKKRNYCLSVYSQLERCCFGVIFNLEIKEKFQHILLQAIFGTNYSDQFIEKIIQQQNHLRFLLYYLGFNQQLDDKIKEDIDSIRQFTNNNKQDFTQDDKILLQIKGAILKQKKLDLQLIQPLLEINPTIFNENLAIMIDNLELGLGYIYALKLKGQLTQELIDQLYKEHLNNSTKKSEGICSVLFLVINILTNDFSKQLEIIPTIKLIDKAIEIIQKSKFIYLEHINRDKWINYIKPHFHIINEHESGNLNQCLEELRELIKLNKIRHQNSDIDDWLNEKQQLDPKLKQLIIQQLQNPNENCNFDSLNEIKHLNEEFILELKDLLLKQPLVGVYGITDEFAPHKHEQVKKLEPTLMRRTSSIMHNQVMGFQRQQSALTESFNFLLELLPDNTYQVKSRKITNQREIIFLEFYNFVFPKFAIKVFEQTQEEFNKQFTNMTIVDFMMDDLNRYQEFLYSQLSIAENEFVWNLDFPVYLDDGKYKFRKELLSIYSIQKLQNLMFEFINKVKINCRKEKEASKINWRVNIHSFLETFVVRLVEQYGESKDIFSIVKELLDWNTLIVLFYQLIYHNFTDAQQILKVLKGIYVEFQEADPVDGLDMPGLDQIFTFKDIKYQLYNQIMIIKIGVGIKQQTEEPKQISKLDLQIQFQDYIFNLVNKYDLFLQIFNPEQIVQFIFNKFEKDKQMQTISKKLSKIYRKDFTIGIDHQSLAKAFYKKIYTLKHQTLQNKLDLMKENAQILFRIDTFFEKQLFQYIQDEFQSHQIQHAFQLRLYTILNGLRNHIPFDDMMTSNKSKVIPQSQLIKQSIFKLKYCKYTYLFGFHLDKNFQIQTLKLGQIFSLFKCDEDKDTLLIEGQYVGKNKNSDFIFYKLSKKRKPLKLAQILEKQQQFSQAEDLDSEYQICKIDNILLTIKYMKKWPQDPNFNKNILNIFLVDSHNYVHLVKQNEFKQILLAISSQSDDHKRQDMLDKTFGKGIVNSLNEISLTQMNPVIPEIINFEFVNKENNGTQSHEADTFKIILDDNSFEISSLQPQQFNVATQVDMCRQIQKQLKPFKKALEAFKELQNNQIIYDNSLNGKSDEFIELLSQEENILIIFLNAYRYFLKCKATPKLENSMEYLLDLNSISQQKRQLFNHQIKKIEFHYVNQQQYEDDDLIQFKEHILTILIKVDINKQQLLQPDEDQILIFIQNQIIDQLVIDNPKISISYHIDSESLNLLIQLFLGLKALLKYFSILSINQNINIYVISSQIQQFCTIEQEKLEFNIDRFEDFFIDHSTLDYLNQGVFKKTNFKYIGEPYLPLGQLNYDISKLIEIPEKFEYQILVYKSGIQTIFENGLIELEVEKSQKIYVIIGERQADKVIYRQIEALIVGNQILHLQHLIEQKSAVLKNQRVTILVTNLLINKSLHEQFKPIFEFVCKEKEDAKVGLLEAKSQKYVKFDYKLISKSYLLLSLQSEVHNSIKIKCDDDKSNELQFQEGDKIKEFTILFQSVLDVDLTKTVHILRSVGDFENGDSGEKNYKLIKYKQRDTKYNTSEDYEKILLSLVKKNLQSQSIRKLDRSQISTEPLTQDQINLNVLQNLYRKQRNKCTRAGEKRFDYLEFKDNEGAYSNKFNVENAIYVHRSLNNVTYVPIIHKVNYKEKEMIALEWEPTVKGIYDLYLNETYIAKGEFVVIANQIQWENSKLEYEFNQEKINFFERIKFTFSARDKHNNPFSIQEQEIVNEFEYAIQSTNEQQQLDYDTDSLNENGQWKVQIWFKTEDIELMNKPEITEACIDLTLAKQQQLIKVNLQGISKGFKVNKFVRILLEQMDLDREVFTFRRANFLEDLLKLQEKSLRCRMKIEFEDEDGIDAGGLRREFFDLVGQTLKDENYKFFSSSSVDMDKYFWHPAFKNSDQANLFGKIIANSIINEMRVGIEFILPFWKVILDEPIVFDDLKYILDDQTMKNYELLRTIDPSILELDYTISEGNSTFELIENGKDIKVTSENVDDYLQKLANYQLKDKYKQVYDGFRGGMFDSIIDKEILKRWLTSEDMYILTLGDQVLSSDSILEKTYIDGPNVQQQFWKRYVSELSQKELKQVLKFITGSSSIPVEKSDYKIKVEFHERDVNQLPMSHTCYQSIEVPMYPTFIMLKQKVDLALSVGLEGFGFG